MYKNSLTRMLQSNTVLFSYNYSSPVGDILLLADDLSLKAIHFKKTCSDTILSRFKQVKMPPIAACIEILDGYFAPKNRFELKNVIIKEKNWQKITYTADDKSFELLMDLSQFTKKEQIVYNSLLQVAYGETISYQKLALKAEVENASRFVGSSMAKNLFPIIIPCHRVIKSDGSLGNYSGGVDKKKFLLDHESRL